MTKLKLDGRRSHSKNIKQLKQQLTETPISTAKQILVGQIARNTVVEEQMFKKAMEQNLFDENGEPNIIIKQYILRYQGASKTALVELLKLENKLADEQDSEGVFDDIFNQD